MDIENIKFYESTNYDDSKGVYSLIDLIDKYLLDYDDLELYLLPGNTAQFYLLSNSISILNSFEYYYIKDGDYEDDEDYSKFEESFQCLKEKRKRLLKLNKLGI